MIELSWKSLGAGALLALIAVFVRDPAWAGEEFEAHVISSRADMVSGGNVLVELKAPSRSMWGAQLNGRDITGSFRASAATGSLLARLTGLQDGRNTLQIRVNGETRSTLEILNHPLSGPLFSGPHQQPFICETLANGLGSPMDPDCNAATVVQYYYKSTAPEEPINREAMITSFSAPPGGLAPGFKILDPSRPLPSDVAQILTSDGRTVNYIVRREIGTINRAVYDIQLLHEPGQPLPSPWARKTPGWNGRLVYLFGGGCGTGYRQGKLGLVGRIQEPLLSQGYALATSTLNMFVNGCNDRISAETLSMVKEHFIKEYGNPIHTIGWGGSGGSMQEYLIAQNYPGLLDGIISFISFPDMTSTAQSATDCVLLAKALATSKHPWTEEQKASVAGFATMRSCKGWGAGGEYPFPILDPQRFCTPLIPEKMIYDRRTNPNGLRCDIYTNEINFLGRSPDTGFAHRLLDNIGVQYGLVAFNEGKIDAEQFVELNEGMGGYDGDGHIVPTRTEADPEAVHMAYQRGLILTGGGGLSRVPIIDWRPYADDLADIHDRFRSFVSRARLIASNGNADNQVLLVDPRSDLYLIMTNTIWNDPDARFVGIERDLVTQMDLWLDNTAADAAPGGEAAKIARNKPPGLADSCRATNGERIVEPATYTGPGRCNQLYPSHGDPRIAAEGPLTDDVLKCTLKPINPDEYSQPLSPEQLLRLKQVFPTGVCDYSRPGIGQQVTEITWDRYRPLEEHVALNGARHR